jgi:DNA repair exonuclease SbcCD ATPase subunit
MEEMIVNLLTQMPLAVAVLVIWYLMSREQSKAEDKRETNRAADNAAQNKTVDTLLQTAVSLAKSVGTLVDKVNLLVDHTSSVESAIKMGFDEQATSIKSAATANKEQHGKIENRVSQMDMKIDDIIAAIAELKAQMADVQARVDTMCKTNSEADSKTEAAMQKILAELALMNANMTRLVEALTTKQAESTATDES